MKTKYLFAIVSFILSGAGFFMLTPATNGVGSIALAAVFAIGARIAQASDHHREVMAVLKPPAAAA